MDNYDKFIEVGISRVGFHRWSSSPSFLKYYHRHVFHITVRLKIDKDREVEFFDFQKVLDNLIDNSYIYNQEMLTNDFTWTEFFNLTGEGVSKDVLVINSCEDFAEWLFRFIAHKGFICVEVKVSEDGENASIIKTGS